MTLLYFLQFFLVAAALGLAAWSTPRAFANLGFAARIMMAISLTPLALSVLTLGLATLWPGAPRLVFQAAPCGLAVGLIAWLARSGLPMPPPLKLDGLDRIGLVIAALALITVLAAGLRSAQPPPTAHDMLIYLIEAKAFVQDPSLASIPAFEASPGEIIKTHPHNFFFQGYLAQALMFAEGPPGYPNDLQARLAIQVTLPLMLLGLLGLARAILPTWAAALALPFMLFFHSDYMSAAGSIDAFRLSPFLVVVSVMTAAVTRKRPPSWPTLLFLGVLTGLTVAVHTLNIVIMLIASVAIIASAMIGSARFRNVFYVGASCIPFVIFGLLDKIGNYLSYGTPLGRGMYYLFYVGTPLEAKFESTGHWTGAVDIITAFWRFSLLAGAGLMLAAALSALVLMVQRTRPGRVRPALVGLVTSFLIWIPLMPGLGLQGAMLSNLRYGLAASALASVVLAVAVSMLIKWATAGRPAESGRRFALCGAAGAFVGVTSTLAWLGAYSPDWLAESDLARTLEMLVGAVRAEGVLASLRWSAVLAIFLAPTFAAAGILAIWKWFPARWKVAMPSRLLVGTVASIPVILAIWTTSLWSYPVWSSSDERTIRDLTGLAERHAANGAWVVDDYTIAYYSARPPLFLYAGNGAPLLQALDIHEAKRQLAIKNVRMVALQDQRAEWWPSTALFRALATDPEVEQRTVGKWRVFLLGTHAPTTRTRAQEG